MPLVFSPLRNEDIAEITEIEREAFPTPWPPAAFRRELDNRLAHYFVLRELTSPPNSAEGSCLSSQSERSTAATRLGREAIRRRSLGRLVGYAGIWTIIDEAHLTTIAVRDSERGRGYGELLLIHAIEHALAAGAETITLEVRESNSTAQRLYRKYGFAVAGIRKNYYSEIHEDALIMTSEVLTSESYRSRFSALRENAFARNAAVLDEDSSTATGA